MGFFSDALKFEIFNTKDMWKKIKKDPERAFIGAIDPWSSKAWGKVLGKDYEPIVDQMGGAYGGHTISAFGNKDGGVYQRAQEAGINTKPAGSLQDAAHIISAFYAAGGAAGAGGGSGAGTAAAGTGTETVGGLGSVGTAGGVGAAEAAIPEVVVTGTAGGGLGGLEAAGAGAAGAGAASSSGSGNNGDSWRDYTRQMNGSGGGNNSYAQQQEEERKRRQEEERKRLEEEQRRKMAAQLLRNNQIMLG